MFAAKLKLLNSNQLALGLIIFFALLVRLIFIDQIPPGIANDEINILLNAQSLRLTGQSIPGVVTGTLFNPTGDLSGGIHSELSSLVPIPFLAIFGFNFLAVKLPFILASIAIVMAGYLVIKKLINPTAGLVAAILLAVNPWTIFYARSAYESILSSAFYLWAIYLVLSLKNWRKLWSLPLFIAGFLSYFSAKTLLLPITLITSIIYFFCFKPKPPLKPLLAINLVIIIFLLIYLPILNQGPAGSRFGELNSYQTQQQVNQKRSQSLDSPITPIFNNKYIEDARYRLQAAFGTLSLNYLFIHGQPESIPSLHLPDHGFLYLIDLPLIILGLYFLSQKNRPALFLFGGLIATTFIPNFLNLQGTTYSIRTVILFPLLCLISAIGFYYLLTITTRRKIMAGVFLAIYLMFVGNFFYQYFYRLPIDKTEGWFFQDRVLSRYLNLAEDFPITIISSYPKQLFYRYLFYTDNYQSANASTINNSLANKTYTFKNLTITSNCQATASGTIIYDTTTPCAANQHGSSIASLKDGRAQFIITNDPICGKFITQHYPMIKDIKDLEVEKLSTAKFCQMYLTDISK